MIGWMSLAKVTGASHAAPWLIQLRKAVTWAGVSGSSPIGIAGCSRPEIIRNSLL